MTGSAGKPPYIPEVTITPSPRPRPAPVDDDGPPVTMIRAVSAFDPGDGPPTEPYTHLDAAVDHSMYATEQIDAVLPNHDLVATAPERTGYGSATDLPDPEPRLSRRDENRALRAAQATIRKYRRRLIAARVFMTVLILWCIAITLFAAQAALMAWDMAQDSTLVEQRTVSPWLSLTAAALLMAVLAVTLMLLGVRRGR